MTIHTNCFVAQKEQKEALVSGSNTGRDIVRASKAYKKKRVLETCWLDPFQTWRLGLDLKFSEHMFLSFKHFKTRGQVFSY
jgi:hypothetical protein